MNHENNCHYVIITCNTSTYVTVSSLHTVRKQFVTVSSLHTVRKQFVTVSPLHAVRKQFVTVSPLHAVRKQLSLCRHYIQYVNNCHCVAITCST